MFVLTALKKVDLPRLFDIEDSIGGWDKHVYRKQASYPNRFAWAICFRSYMIGWCLYELGRDSTYIVRLAIDPTIPEQFRAIDCVLWKLAAKLSVSRRSKIQWTIPEDQVALLCHLRDTTYGECGGFRAMVSMPNEFGNGLDGIQMVYDCELETAKY